MPDIKCPECGALLKKKHLNEDKCWKCKTENISEVISSQIECSECGALNLPKNSLCSKCNKPLYGIFSGTYDIESKKSKLNICIDCNIQNTKDAKFCKSCGKKLFKEKEITIIKCRKCGKEYNDTFQYCDIDGEKLYPITKVVDELEYKNSNKKIDNDNTTIISRGSSKTPKTFGLNFWIFMGFLQGVIAFIFSVILGYKTEYLPNPYIGLLISILGITSAYGVYNRKLYGLLIVFISLLLVFIGGLLMIIDNSNPRGQARGFGSIVACCLWFVYFYKRKHLFTNYKIAEEVVKTLKEEKKDKDKYFPDNSPPPLKR